MGRRGDDTLSRVDVECVERLHLIGIGSPVVKSRRPALPTWEKAYRGIFGDSIELRVKGACHGNFIGLQRRIMLPAHPVVGSASSSQCGEVDYWELAFMLAKGLWSFLGGWEGWGDGALFHPFPAHPFILLLFLQLFYLPPSSWSGKNPLVLCYCITLTLLLMLPQHPSDSTPPHPPFVWNFTFHSTNKLHP